ncbi:MAG: hypothetical protein CML20_14610 [Rheinheimera sp.]|jgi:hypothetical protein|nr:hypothetical protein [Rheinheimera sp.]
MDLKIIINYDNKPLLEQSKLANSIMHCYFNNHNLIASEALNSCEDKLFIEEECMSDELAKHWLIACDLAFVAVCGGIAEITGRYTLSFLE